ncbi:MAG: RHS repeat-associated core domain-containing protein [Anaerolineales bacterium]
MMEKPQVVARCGDLTSAQRYLPFGEFRDIGTPITQTDFGFTGQRGHSYIQLIDFNAQFYSPSLGRFIQPDSII